MRKIFTKALAVLALTVLGAAQVSAADDYSAYPQVPSSDYFPLQAGTYTKYSTTSSTTPKYESGNQNIGYLKNGGVAEYTFYCSRAAYYNLSIGIKMYSGGTISATVTDVATGKVELSGDFEIASSGDYASQSYEFADVLTTGAKVLKMTFNATHTGWIMNYKNVTLAKRADYDDGSVKYKVAYSQNNAEAGTVSQTPSGDDAPEGSTVKFEAKPNFGYRFVKWTDAAGNDLSTDAVYSVTVNADVAVKAVFEAVKTYELTLNVENGYTTMVTVSPAPTVIDRKNMYEEGTVVSLSAAENKAVKFANWSNGATSNSTTVTMDANQSITAYYSLGDFLAAWDLHDTSKSQPYTADYASSEDNQNAGLYLRNFDSNMVTSRGFWVRDNSCAVIWGDDTNYAYEMNLNTTNFSDISIEMNLWYSYNYWEKVQAQYSLDGAENWVNVGEPITMTSSSTTYQWTLPAACEHQAKVLFRLLPDVTSQVLNEGASTYRPIWISDIYVFGKGAVYDDGVAPVLVSYVPNDGATGASSTGRIALTFDEKVKLTDAAVATLTSADGQAVKLSGTATGTIVTFAYTGLDYKTQYTFALAAGSVADQGDNALQSAVKFSFTTMERPTVAKRGFDFVVGVDGTADEAFAAANAQSGDRFRIFVPNGEYLTKGNVDYSMTKLYRTVSIIGQDRDSTLIYNTPAGYGISSCSTIDFSSGDDNYIQDICIENRRGVDGGQAAALHESTERNIYKHATFLGNQDTYVSNHREYFEDCQLVGSVDFICGGGDVWFEKCDLLISRTGSVLTAPATAGTQLWGYVFNECVVDSWTGKVYNQDGTYGYCEAGDGSYTLGRPWQNSPASTFLNTKMNILAGSAGWQSMSDGKVCRFHEFGTVDKNGATVDLTTRSISSLKPAEGSDNPVLTADKAAAYTMSTVLDCEKDGWVPTLYTEQCPAPKVSVSGNTLSWSDDPYASCYVIFKDNVYVANVTTNSYSVTDAGCYTVRAANERGGLGEASAVAVVDQTTGIETITDEPCTDTDVYDLSGRSVKSLTPGVYVCGGRRLFVK